MTLRRIFRRPWGLSLEEQARSLQYLSDQAFRRSSRNSLDHLAVTVWNESFKISGGMSPHPGFKGMVEAGVPKRQEAEIFFKRTDAERYIHKHYLQVRQRVQDACHY